MSEEARIAWRTTLHLNAGDYGALLQRLVCGDDDLGCQREVYTPKKGGVWGEGEVTYHIDGDDTVYETAEAWLAALPTDLRDRCLAQVKGQSQ